MLKKHFCFLLTIGLLIMIPSAISIAGLKEYVPVVKVKYHKATIDTFNKIADYFEQGGDIKTAEYFRSYAEGGGWGSGFIYVDKSGDNYIITNRHVVEQAESVDVMFEDVNGKYTVFQNCPILYVDSEIDLAVVQFPGGKRVFKRGFTIDTEFQKERTQVFSAGFPGLLGRPGWQLATGIISNERAFVPEMVDPGKTYLIQHTSPIDPGNSGGPLLIEDNRDPLGYRVIGVNTWKITNRENTNFAIPSGAVLEVMDRAAEIKMIKKNRDRLSDELIKSAMVLVDELGSENPDYQKIEHFISYDFVGRQGWESFIGLLDYIEARRDRALVQEWERSFFNDPIQTMKSAILNHFFLDISMQGNLNDVRFDGINPEDREKIDTANRIRTSFTIGDREREVVWIFEYGYWRISDMELYPLTRAGKLPGKTGVPEGEAPGAKAPYKRDIKSALIIGVKPAVGAAGAGGDEYDLSAYLEKSSIFNWSIGLTADYYISSGIWVTSGLNYIRKGMYYELYVDPAEYGFDWLEVEEYVNYIQIPVMLKWSGGFFAGAGIGIDILVGSGGKAYNNDNNYNITLESNYYENLKKFNLSLLASMGWWYLLDNKKTVLGLELSADYHIFNDWKTTGDTKSRYHTYMVGGFVKYFLKSFK